MLASLMCPAQREAGGMDELRVALSCMLAHKGGLIRRGNPRPEGYRKPLCPQAMLVTD